MLEKYRATIHGDKIEWDDEIPESLKGNKAIKVDVTLVSRVRKLRKSNGKKMAAALSRIAAAGGVPAIKDAVKWQRAIRKDRPLPGRKGCSWTATSLSTRRYQRISIYVILSPHIRPSFRT